ncbi:MAG TPA: hydrogenase maturation protease [Anaerolineales bacterium]|nr:hydrogenase maturation protease [Anaerolineales bacterium]
MKTLIVGLGNPILGDDGIGWKVAEEIEKKLQRSEIEENQVEVVCLSVGGLSLMEHLIGYDHAILVDAFATDAQVGSISVLKLSQLSSYSPFHLTGTHDTSLQHAIELGRMMGASLPKEVMVVGISTRRIYEFSEELSPPLARVVPYAVRIVFDLLKDLGWSNKEENQLYE